MIDREIIRFHRADSQEEQDAVVAFGEHLRLLAAKVTHLAFDYKAKKAVTASVPTALDFAGANAPRYEEIHKDFSHWWRLIHPACLVSTKHRNVWEGTGGGQVSPNAALLDDDQNGKVKLANGTKLKIAEADAPGDGTVPWQSGAAPEGKNGVELVFGHGQSHPGSHNAEFGYDHQENYNDPRALYATLYAIVKIAQNAHWHKKESA